MKKALLICMAAFVAAAYAQSADAGILANKLVQLQFENREIEVNVSGGADGNLDVGDQLRGILRVNQLDPGAIVFGATSADEPTGIFDVTVSKIIIQSTLGTIDQAVGSTVSSASAITGTAGSVASVFVLFSPTNTTGAEGLLAGKPAGSVVALYEGGANLRASLDAAGTLAGDIAAASDGTYLGSLGFGLNDYAVDSDWGKAGNGYWYAVLDVVITGAGTGQADTASDFYYGLTAMDGPIADDPVGLFNKQLPGASLIPSTTNILNNKGITEFIPSVLATSPVTFDLVGKGTTSVNTTDASGDFDTRWPIFSNDPAQLFATPEPSSMVLIALGGLGVIPALRRRKKEMAA